MRRENVAEKGYCFMTSHAK